jgi:hypothetical protein
MVTDARAFRSTGGLAAAALTLIMAGSVACNSILGIEDHELADPGGSNTVEIGPRGCFRGTPSTDADFFNQCTTAQFARFDNCARMGLCDGAVWPLIDPIAPDLGPPAGAGPPLPTVGCYHPTLRNRLIFMQGSTNFTSFIRAMAPLVAKNGYVIVWQPTSSCAGAGAGGFDSGASKNLMRNPTSPTQTSAAFYDATGSATPCLLGNSPMSPDGTSEITDIGESDVFANGCPLPVGQAEWVPGSADYPNVGHYLGPIQAMVFVTPPPSTQRVISAEAARVVFGMGGSHGISQPWIDPNHIFMRGSTTGTNNILSRAIDVPNDKWWGIDLKTASAMQTAILTASATDAEATIGILSIDYADRVKDSLHILFFQARGQLAGFLPDSSPNTFDKQNVRDGHYSAWGPIHLYTKLIAGSASGEAAAFVAPFTVPNQALVDASIAGGTVPVCAMHVSRDQEMGPLKAFSPTFSCDCYYDLKVNSGNTCQKCNGPADCPSGLPACNLGFCQAD